MLMRILLGGLFLLLLTSCGPQTYNYSRVNDSLPQLVVQLMQTLRQSLICCRCAWEL